ncbi:CDP-glycerol glycerophosphotransferase family protein [Levilactobacillus sp. HBUAS70063]|uniref:CDP-glycerol glycerophosphotransferase family protein n=1 Tax=Levilactobacillus sp. HBUAS70063 TaxID=3109359 RepID=UPI003132BD17
MKFSLITPCQNEELPQLLALRHNLLAQTTTDFEWVIALNEPLNLTSADWQVPFAVRQVTFHGATVGAARNAAMAAASGDWLVFVDSDDYLTADALATLAAITPFPAETFGDLYQYPTYEPHTSFVASSAQTAVQDNLPKWGGAKRRQPKNRAVNLSTAMLGQLTPGLTVTPTADNWLQHKYVSLAGDSRWNQFNRQLKITGKVVNRQLVQDHHLAFDETNALYPDYPFLTQVMAHTNRYVRLANPTYIRVKHNDPVNQPSVHQLVVADRWQQRIASWQASLAAITAPDLHLAFSRYCLYRLHRFLYMALATGATAEDPSVTDVPGLMVQLQAFLRLVDETALDEVSLLSRRILKHIRQHATCPQRAVDRIVHLRQLGRVIKHRGRGVTRLSYMWWFTKLPLKPNTILYESFLGRNFSDSPKAVYNYLQTTYPGQFKHVWISNPGVTGMPTGQPNTKVVKRFGWRYMYYLATAKFQVINMRQPKWFVKRPGTKFLATWHGTPLKHLVFDMDNVASANPLYKQIFFQQSRQWDYLVTANQFSVDVFEHAFMYPVAKMLKSGYPRNDILSAPGRDTRARQIKEKLGIPLDKKIILYAPTWRDDDYYGVGDYKFTLKLDINRLKRELGDEYVLVLRTHYFITEHLDTTGFGDFVYNESSYDDIAELYLISDVLITDYSSVFFDYAILKRPILYFVYDYEKYGSVLRGFYLDMEKDLPGPLLKTNDDVLDALHHLPQVTQDYAAAYDRFSQRFNAWEDGHATQRVVEAFFDADDLK